MVGEGAKALRIEIEEAPPRVAFKAIARVLRILGPALAGLVSGAGLKLGDRLIPWSELVTEGGAFAVINALMMRLADIDPDEVVTLLEELTIGRTWVHEPGAENPILITTGELLDLYIPDGLAMIGLLRFALEVNARPTSPADATNAGSSAGEMSRRPAGTPSR